jgi:5-methylcytosine-specific restriction endonuclease McrA
MPGSFCTICRRRIKSGSRCSKHRIVSPSSRSWHERGAARVREQVLARDGYACTRCGAGERLQVHHIVPARADGATTMENCVTLCFDCHIAVEAEKRAG